jgi:phage repressor protein C with HTH and peptisase S24 domain
MSTSEVELDDSYSDNKSDADLGFSARFVSALGSKSLRAFAKETGISYGALHKYVSGTATPTLEKLVLIAKYAGVSISWLATGEEENSGSAPSAHSAFDIDGHPVDLEEFVFIPRYNVKAAAGHGVHLENETRMHTMAFRRYWLEQVLRVNPKNCAVITVVGDSMEGTLNDRDVILVDIRDNLPGDGIYVLRIDSDNLVVKRVQRLPGSVLHITSANPAYQPFDVKLDAMPNDVSIVGKVLWFGRTM